MASDITPQVPQTPEGEALPAAPVSRGPKIFFGPKGLRVVWRVLIYLVLVILLSRMTAFIRPVQRLLSHLAAGDVTPFPVIVVEGARALAILVAAAIMGLVEGKSLADYERRLRQRSG